MTALARGSFLPLIAVVYTTALSAQQPVPVAWDSVDMGSLSIPEQRGVLAPPLYDPRLMPSRVALLDTTAIYGAPVISEWEIGFGAGFADYAYFLVFTGSIDTPPTIGWTARSHRYWYEAVEAPSKTVSDSLVDQVRTCLYRLGDTAIAYVAIHEPAADTISDSYARPSGVYRIGPHSNLSEPQVFWAAPVPDSLTAACRQTAPSEPTLVE